MTTEECYRLREESNFISPLKPLERRQMLCVFATRGTYEWLVHTDDVDDLLKTGVKVDSVPLEVAVLEPWPYMNAVMIRATLPAVETYVVPAHT